MDFAPSRFKVGLNLDDDITALAGSAARLRSGPTLHLQSTAKPALGCRTCDRVGCVTWRRSTLRWIEEPTSS